MKQFLVPSIIISSVLLIGYFVLNEHLLGGLLHEHFPLLVYVFFGQSVPVGWLMQAGQKDPSQFPIFVIAAIGFRMITSLMLLLVFYALETEELVSLTIQFSVLYLVYLVFELIVVLSNLRRN